MENLIQGARDGQGVGIAGRFSGFLASGILFVAIAVLCWPGIESLFAAWDKPEYSHGYLIPLIAILLFAIKRQNPEFSGTPATRRHWGVAVVVFGAAMALLGRLAHIPDIITYGMLVAIGGFILASAGFRRGLLLWPAWLYLFFMLPLPNFIYWPLSIRLQFLSSDIGVRIIQLLNIPVFLDGNIIDLGLYKLQVAEACNGLRYLFPLMSFGFLFAVLFNGSWWKKLLLFLSTMPITIGMNSVRIGIIGVLVNYFGIAQAEGFLHLFEGWVIFVVCIAILYVEALVLRRLFSGKAASGELFTLNFGKAWQQIRGWTDVPSGRPIYSSIAALLVALGALAAVSGRVPEPIARHTMAEFPMTLGQWHGKQIFLEKEIEQVLGADDYLLADYSSTGKPDVNLLVSYYASQTSGSGVHSPEVCIPAGGWEVSSWGQHEVSLNETSMGKFWVNRAKIQKGQSQQLVYYWFEQRGRHLTSDYFAKAYTVWDSVSRGRSDGALIRVVTVIDGNGIAAADARLQAFLEEAGKQLPTFVPP